MAQTYETALELGRRVRKNLDPSDVAAAGDRARVPEPLRHDAVRLDDLYEAVGKVNEQMPKMVDALLEDFFRTAEVWDEERKERVEIPVLSTDDRRKLFETFAKFALTDKRLADSMGLLREQAAANGGGVSLGSLSINILELQQKGPDAFEQELKRLADSDDV